MPNIRAASQAAWVPAIWSKLSSSALLAAGFSSVVLPTRPVTGAAATGSAAVATGGGAICGRETLELLTVGGV
jgi:hypothetical protein